MKLVGIDGCKAGWVVARIDESVDSFAFDTMPNLAAVFKEVRAGELLAIADVPIGLPERGPRACDRSARELLGWPRRNSVFPAPCRPVLTAGDYREACELNFRVSGKRVTRQLYGILAKIREVDEAMSPALQTNFREAHPEVTFAALSGGHGLAHSKETVDGEIERLALLRRFFPGLDITDTRARLGLANVARDDVVDALACLVTAQRVRRGQDIVLPDGEVQYDARGLRMEIIA